MASGTNQSAEPRRRTTGAITRPARAMEGSSMKRRKFITVGFVALAALVFAIAAGGVSGATKKSSITVWLQNDAQNGWPDLVAAANAQFQKAHPGTNVDVQYQTWTTHIAKFDATLAAGAAPDVVEMGNSEMTKYMAAGAFQDLTVDEVVVRQLEHLARRPGTLHPVQRQALRRAVLRRLAHRHLPHRPVEEGRAQGSEVPGPVHGGREDAEREVRQEGLLARLHRRPGLVRRVELRVRLRRSDRDPGQRQVEGPARFAEVAGRADRVQELLPRGLEGEQDHDRDPTVARTTSTHRAWPRR